MPSYANVRTVIIGPRNPDDKRPPFLAVLYVAGQSHAVSVGDGNTVGFETIQEAAVFFLALLMFCDGQSWVVENVHGELRLTILADAIKYLSVGVTKLEIITGIGDWKEPLSECRKLLERFIEQPTA